MGIGKSVAISASALDMQRARMEVIASNMANSQTTRTEEGGPYRRRLPVITATIPKGASFADSLAGAVRGVKVTSVEVDPRPPQLRFQPSHPDADARGFVAYPNIDPAEEMVDMLSAVRSYEANINVIASAKRMSADAMRIIR